MSKNQLWGPLPGLGQVQTALYEYYREKYEDYSDNSYTIKDFLKEYPTELSAIKGYQKEFGYKFNTPYGRSEGMEGLKVITQRKKKSTKPKAKKKKGCGCK